MGRGGRRRKNQTTKTQVSGENEQEDPERRLLAGDDGDDDEEEGKEGKFFACYLLTSLCPRFKGHTYIGFTVNPRRRIRQHNGEMRSGAFRTKRKRPWEMVLCIYGFPTNVAALQFEWAWQHPLESLAVRKAAATFKSLSGVANNIKLAYTMLTLPSWQSLNLTVNFFSTKYKTLTAGCPSLPEHMRVQVCSMDELPCYSGNDWNAYEDDGWDDIREEFERSLEDQQPVDDDNTMEPNMIPDTISSRVSNEEKVLEETNCEEDRTLEQYNWSEDVMRSPVDSPVDNSTMEQNVFPDSVRSQVCKENVTEETNYEEDRTLEQYNWSEEAMRWPMDSPIVNECRRQSFTHNDSYEDREMFTLGDERNPEVDKGLKNISPINIVSDQVKDKHSNKSSSISCEVEVIDLFTPSPCYTRNLGSKKRRFSNIACPEIIDLTESPIVV